MKKILTAVLLPLCAIVLLAVATNQGSTTADSTSTWDLSAAASVSPVPLVTSYPSTCTKGSFFMLDLPAATQSGTNLLYCWTTDNLTPIGAVAGYAGPTAVTNTGSDVFIYGTFLPVLKDGGCFYVSFLLSHPAISTDIKLKIDSTTVDTRNNSAAATTVKREYTYCNNASSHVAQTIYVQDIVTAVSPTITGPVTPTGIDWSATHLVSIYTNGASGTVTLRSIRIGF